MYDAMTVSFFNSPLIYLNIIMNVFLNMKIIGLNIILVLLFYSIYNFNFSILK